MSVAPMSDVTLLHGDCRELLRTIPDGSVDAVITDPPYPEIDREYGRMTEAEWHDMMRVVVAECRRVLKPSGSAVFILQPNSERVGRMRPWLWEFMAWTAREWNQVQDAWWWNIAAMATVHCHRDHGLMRPSLKAAVWLGDPDCYRNQASVLDDPSDATTRDARRSNDLVVSPSSHSVRHGRIYTTFLERGGVTPFNVIPLGGNDGAKGSGHGAGTPEYLCDWWTRYICPPGGLVLDPFMGSGTVPIAALCLGRKAIGIEQHEPYYLIARRRIARPHARPVRPAKGDAPLPLFASLNDT